MDINFQYVKTKSFPSKQDQSSSKIEWPQALSLSSIFSIIRDVKAATKRNNF